MGFAKGKRDWRRTALAMALALACFFATWAVFGLRYELNDDAQLANIAIHPSARGLGYGEILLRTAMEALFREGCTSFFLEVRQSNAPAQGLYRKLGYEALAVRKDYYSQPVEDACIMHCQKEKYQWLGHSL